MGKLYKIRIRHDNALLSPAWFLDRVEIVDAVDKETYVFHCERWLAKNKEDCKIDRTLYVKVCRRCAIDQTPYVVRWRSSWGLYEYILAVNS